MNRIILGLGMIAVVAGVSLGASGAFFTDTESSIGNTFTAGALDLKVDSQAHYNKMMCNEVTAGVFQWQPEPGAFPNNQVPADHYPQPGTPCSGTWSEADLVEGIKHRFFNLTDIKPGDEGENTISLHVYDNDAWGCFLVDNVQDSDVTCTEPESEDTDDASCTPNGTVAEGELGGAITFDAWLDEGTTPGFQCNNPGDEAPAGASCPLDAGEGDNIRQENETLFWENETVDEVAEGPFALKDVLSNLYTAHACTVATGDTDYGNCHGLAADGRMVGSVTYYFGLAWDVPTTAGNEIQTDNLVSDMIFEVAQHRNNPEFSCTPPRTATTLTLEKVIQQDGVDIVTEALWTLTASSTSNMTVISGTETAPAVTAAPVPAGDYVLSESSVPGFEQTGLACVGGTLVGSTVTVPLGANVVCTFTNTEDELPV